MGEAQRQPHGERAARAGVAGHADGAAVQADQLADQRQAEAAAVAAAAVPPGGPVEAVEHRVQLALLDAGAGVGDPQHDLLALLGEVDSDPALTGVLDRVAEQVEDDLLPGVAVHPGRPGLRRAGHRQLQPRPFDDGRERVDERRGRLPDLRRREHAVVPAGLQGGDVQQTVDELEHPLRVALRELHLGADGGVVVVAQPLQRPEDEVSGSRNSSPRPA